MDCRFKNYFQQIISMTMVGLLGVTLIGCAITSTVPVLSREQVPQGGRFTVVVRETGKLTMMNVGLTILSNSTQRIKTPNLILEGMRTAVIDLLASRHSFEYVPNNLKLEFVPPPYYINSYDGSFSTGSNDATKAQEGMLTDDMKKLADELKLDFIVIINEWGAGDHILHTNQPLDGFGVYFRSVLGMRRIYAYIAYQLRVFEPKTGHYRNSDNWVAKQLNNNRWVEVKSDSPLSFESIKPFVLDIESLSPPDDISVSLCKLGLLPIKEGATGFFDSGKCKDSYRSK